MAEHRMGRGEDGVYRDPLPFRLKIRLLMAALLLAGAALFLALRGCGGEGQPAPRNAGPVRVSCVGDSITYGFGLENREQTCWVSLLADLLPEGSTTANFGVSGTCALEDGYAPWERTAWAQEFWNTEEDVVILMLGTNDVCDSRWDAARFEQDLGSLVERIQAKPGTPRVIVMLPPRLFSSPDLDARLVDEAIPAIQSVAERTGAGVVDLRTLTQDRPEWFPDGVHPNEEAQEAIATCVSEAVQSV